MADNKDENSGRGGFGSRNLDEALEAFTQGVKAIGRFCAEEALPAAEKGAREGLDSLDRLLRTAREAMDEAFAKAKDECGQSAERNSDTEKD